MPQETSSSESAPGSPSTSHSTLPSTLPSPALSTLSLSDSEIDVDEARKLKAEANRAFTRHEFTKAATLYSQAIESNPTDATLFCNRAYTRMKLEEYGYAIGDCTKAIELDPKYVKAFFRRALCQLQVLKPQLAVVDFKKTIALDPGNTTARQHLEATQKLIRRTEFEKAIELEEEKDAVERCREVIAEDGCPVDKDYKGPILPLAEDASAGSKTPKYRITREFVQELLEWYKTGHSLPRRYVWEIVLGAFDVFSKEQSLVDIDIEDGIICDVVGDVHGQFYDYLHLLELMGKPDDKHIVLMNGDLVDRGSWSIEVIVVAFAFKWLYPKRMYINRGNHEAKEMNRSYGFEGEAKSKHGEMTYKRQLMRFDPEQLFSHAFTALPLGCLISATSPPVNTSTSPSPAILSPEGRKRYMVVHGGLFSKDDVTLDDIRQISRIGKQPGIEGIMCELLWTDPQEMPGRGPSKRGVGISFGPDVTRRWCEANHVTGIFRSHEVRQDGYAIEHEGLCTTVFSAPNYVDQGGNKGAFIRVNAAGSLEYRQFEAVPHPPMKPMAYVQGALSSLFM